MDGHCPPLLFRVRLFAVGEQDPELHGASRRIVLARERPFRLGDVEVEPATRQLVVGDIDQTIEPRVMQVLVALAESPGRIVTRDELVERCWNGRIVGDDAVNRALSRVRQLASAAGPAAFTVETIPRVGYRLVTSDASRSDFSPRRPLGFFDRRAAVIGATGLLGTAALVGLPRIWPSSDSPSREARQLFERAFILRYSGQPEDNRQAIAYLQDATRIAPRYGEAWGALALAYRDAIDSESPDRTEGFDQLLAEAAQRADRYDPGNADADAARVSFKLLFGHWVEFEAIARRFIKAHPDHVYGHELLGTVLMEVGRWHEAVDPLRTAGAKNVFSPIIPYKLTVALWSSGAISEADTEIDAALRRWPQHGATWQTKIKLLMLTGRPRAALGLVTNPAARPMDEPADQTGPRDLVLQALISQRSSDRDAAVGAMLAQLRSVPSNALPTMVLCAALDRPEIAMDLIEGFYLGRGPWSLLSSKAPSKGTHPLFQPPVRPLWNNPRFTNVLSRIGLARYWRDTGSLPDYQRFIAARRA